jgi:hypothetical protein
MNNVEIDYINYYPNIHRQFPIILSSKVYTKDGIINLVLEGSSIFNEIVDDIGYDNKGKYLSVIIGQWHHIETGNFISNEDFYDLDEQYTYDYDYVSILIKIYTKEDYRACYHNDFDRKIVISFIPYTMINFTERNCTKKLFEYKL